MPTTISPLDTALVALIYKGKLKSGERVLIRGVGGVVFFFAVQIAKSIGGSCYCTGFKNSNRTNKKLWCR